VACSPPLALHPLPGGKRKSKKKVAAKVVKSVAKTFKCPFCSHESSCEVKLDMKREVGSIRCNICGESDESRINTLSDPVDVYVQWLDGLEDEKARQSAAGAGGGGR
jgi:transcription elongation factor Elf1